MSVMFYYLAVIWSLQVLLCGTAVVSVRLASRSRLAAALKRIRREGRIKGFDAYERQYAMTAQLYRQLAVVLFVLTVHAIFAPTGVWTIGTLKVVLVSAVWSLLFGVVVPTAWARHAGEAYLARTLPMLEGARRLSKPLLHAADAVDEVVRRLAGAPREADDLAEEMEREILDAVIQAETSGAVDPTEKAMIRSAMDLDERSAGEIMTPRTRMVGIEVGADYEQARGLVLTAGHSRIPVYEGTMDRIVGVLYAKDLLRVSAPATFSLRETMREATFVPETKDLVSLLREFQTNRVHMAIVLDEYGGTAGLVTIEDILEELVGEITDEHDRPPPSPIDRIDARIVDVDARVRVEEVNEALETSLPEDEAYDTIGGYVFSKLGRIPTKGESIEEDGVRIEVLEAQDRSIHRLRIHLREPVDAEE